MSFLHVWGIWLGLAAMGLPIAIHLLTRPRPVRVPLSTVRFVLRAIEQKKARHRLRDILVLLLRTAAVLLLAFAFARPLLGAKPLVDPGAPGSIVRVVVLDTSMSMGEVSNNAAAFDSARSMAARYLRYQPGLRADVILAGARARPIFDAVSTNVGALREAVASAAVQPQRLDAQGAINRAGELLAVAPLPPGGRAELLVISNFQRANWDSVDFSPIPRDATIEFESVAPPRQPNNLAILNVVAKGRLEQGKAVRVEVEIGNYSPSPRDVQAQVDLGGAQVYRVQGTCAPGVKTTLSGVVTLPQTPGWLVGQAKLVNINDALAADDARPVALQVRPLPVYALMTRESSVPHASSSHYLERALVPEKPRPGVPSESVVRVDPAQLDRQVLDSASLLVLDHPGNLSDEAINLLATLTRRGRGMLFVAADTIDAQNLARLERVCGDDLKMPVDFVPPDPERPRHDLFLLDWRRDQAPFDQLGDTMEAVAGKLQFNRGLDSRLRAGGLADDVLAQYSDRSAALVLTPCGAGTLAVLNADLTASNLRASAVFVPLIDELCGRMLAASNTVDAAPCGEPLAVYLPSTSGAANGLEVIGPDGHADSNSMLSDDSSGTLWRTETDGPPGVYQVKRGRETVFAAAVAAPASQSDLQTIDPSVLTQRLAAGRHAQFQTAGDAPVRDQAWAWILVGCAGCLIGEVGVLKLFKT